GWEGKMVDDARDLLTAVGYGADGEPWLRLGVGLDVGRAYVGNVGSGEVKDFTALGDVVNTAARLQSSAEAGQVVMSERLFVRLGEVPAGSAPATLELKGKSETEPARVLDYGSRQASQTSPLATARRRRLSDPVRGSDKVAPRAWHARRASAYGTARWVIRQPAAVEQAARWLTLHGRVTQRLSGRWTAQRPSARLGLSWAQLQIVAAIRPSSGRI